MTILRLPPALAAQIEREAREAAPRECCGLIEGAHIDGVFTAAAIYPVRNVAEAADRFEIDPADHFRALHAARANGRQIIGCYHSHPGGKAEPSEADRAGAAEEGFLWLIAGADGLRLYVFKTGAFEAGEVSA